MFKYILAGHLKWPSVAVGEETMPASEMVNWKAAYRIAPFGPAQDDLRAAYATTILFNSNKKKSAKAKGPGDFFPSLDPNAATTDEQKEEQLKRRLEQIAQVYENGPPTREVYSKLAWES